MRRVALGLVGAGLGAVIVVVTLAVAGGGGSTKIGGNVLVHAPGPIDANNSPTVVRNPTQPDNLVASYRVDRPRFNAAVQSSTDGGLTWRPTPLPLPEGLDRPFGPDLGFAPDGTFYVTYSNLAGNGNVPDNLWVARSGDGGRTLSAPVRVTGRLTFQPRIAIGNDGAVHVIWLQGDEVGLLRLAGRPAPVLASRSTDGGRTFSEPVRVSDPERERVGAASPVIDSNGELVVMYEDFKGDFRDFENREGPAWDSPFALVITRSTDGGRTFAKGTELESGVVPLRRFLVFLPEFPSLAAGPGGRLYAAWADGRNGDEDVLLRRSDDGGRTWAAAVQVNDNARGDGTTQNLPRLDVAPDGRVDVIFYDRRHDPDDILTDVYLATSSDRGRSFRNVRVTSQAFDSRIGPMVSLEHGTDFGTRLGLASDDDGLVAVWTDTRNGSDATGRQDVLAAA
ncbi:MAG: sialidase family protein, partial [Acidimicrobiales bacterium]